MATFQWYTRDLDKGFPGMVADTTMKNIDSYAVEEEAGLEPGDAVILGTAENQVKKVASGSESKVIGVVVHHHKEPTTPYYQQTDTVPVMTFGDIYVTVGEAVKAGDPACIMASTFKWGKTGTNVSGAAYVSGAEANGLARLRLGNNVTVIQQKSE